MQRVMISGAFAALAYTAAAGLVARGDDDFKFVDQTWDEICDGSDWTIKWSKGNGKTTSVKVKGENNWSESIGEAKACPGEIDWTVKVPECDKEYSIEIQQEECESLESPKFIVACAGEDEDKEWEDSGDDSKKWADGADPAKTWADAAAPSDPAKTWGDAPAPADVKTWADAADPAKTWADAAAPSDAAKTWADAADPAKTWADAAAPTDAAKTWADASDPAKTWADAAAPSDAAKTWADASSPAAATTPAAGSSWADSPVAPLESKPAVAAYTGAAAQLTGSFSALAAVFFAALAL